MNKLTEALDAHFSNPSINASEFRSPDVEKLVRAIHQATDVQAIQLESIQTKQYSPTLLLIKYNVKGLIRVIYLRYIEDLGGLKKLSAQCLCPAQYKAIGNEVVCGFSLLNGELTQWAGLND